MGLRADILKANGKSYSNGGISANHNEVTIVNIDGPFEPSDDAPAVMLVPGNLPGTVKLVPAHFVQGLVSSAWLPNKANGGVGPMAGGCYVNSSDSRFGQAVRKMLPCEPRHFDGAVSLHDRYETAEQYRSYD